MEMESCVPPGFRFHPTEEELVGYYLKRKVNLMKIDLDVIVDLDLYRMEPWDIQDKCGLGYEEQNEWYFFSHKDKKYPTGTRTNRATAAGFWKATGRDKAVLSKNKMIGMRKTLVFYKGRAPNGRKSDWIMHEYRLQTSEHAPPHEEGWVVCRAFKKPSPSHKQGLQAAWNHQAYYLMNRNNGNPNLPSSSSCSDIVSTTSSFSLHKPSLGFQQHEQFVEDLPQLNSPTISTTLQTNCSPCNDRDKSIGANSNYKDIYNEGSSTDQISQFVDWKNWDDLLPQQQQEQIEAAPSFGHSSLLFSQDYELLLNAETHETQLFTSFPNM